MSTPDVGKEPVFDPDGEIKTQADAKAYGEWLIRQRQERQQAKKKEDQDG